MSKAAERIWKRWKTHPPSPGEIEALVDTYEFRLGYAYFAIIVMALLLVVLFFKAIEACPA